MIYKRLFLILSIALLEILAIYFFKNQIVEFLVFIKDKNLQVIIPILLASPIALLIWFWRDQNKRADIQNAEDTIQQKDFHQVVEWVSAENSAILNNAGLNLLILYMRGDYGPRYAKPASELYITILDIEAE